ncbi:tRNA (uridine(34)/cytosine(34)/5-carboxymethylaminomethyluridine(34)-2'-O)-methyltransferase TrmL [Ferrovum sp. PN-J185]|uniref:tRNA (uridine(34)/cytosine(34)/5- carboxymethylaminomethyluridine(34)-2'-O)- methyltransferase TrmL n=1 Tax=Ferrovum sp. PN-J185 TaxID=1356306 RepID=UPI001E63BE31|nr:tRNA (uridine(34)/cytosine(34)/5-carboxymethylaminomethyluridine(34)-2'-O)-methyltransferase TrmL [Ferrovum sp. PN-J185]MCC6068416.1 tRNA (uridine(34)/cytosine(34)/5-carboxymethylaminomethyluridine(34)-2'-O)-methyltransferase TrmL [Ferrovum sp. PN-J185]MDE1891522.1 tRNA (uridine(34)/cytosine(34)/5-carboxymethylaminomethyluridine(34)-2'-O)-methyltransferase TrmL [Betaproteobacteria bacterium]MDE2055856.1 tRNA (uridine(34)/cytosine(34)/5-carboxymethylaminomethyluridine(34)-2'-O)-methyltransfera
MFDLILYQPEIPPNTGNIIRLCANTGTKLHLIKPLGFQLDDKQLKRAGLDYHEFASLSLYDDWQQYRKTHPQQRIFALTTKGSGQMHRHQFVSGDGFLMGPETRGLPQSILDEFEPNMRIRLPMVPDSRSLNLSNAAAVIVYEAWRQVGFSGAQN